MKRAFIYIFYYNLAVATLLLIGFIVQTGRVNRLVDTTDSQESLMANLDERLAAMESKAQGDMSGLNDEMTILREQVNAVRLGEDIETEILGVDSSNQFQGTITIGSQFEMVDVHKTPLASAEVVGQAYKDLTYLYKSKQDQWYEIDLGDGTVGFVQASFVSEN